MQQRRPLTRARARAQTSPAPPPPPPVPPRQQRKPPLRIKKLARELRKDEWDDNGGNETRKRLIAAVGIKKWWKRVKQFVCVNQTEEDKAGDEGFLRRGGRNIICAITQDSIPTRNAFKFVTATGQVIAYSMQDILRYLKDSGIFRCPCTTMPFTISVVRRLERSAVRAGFCSPNDLIAVYLRRHIIVQSEIEQRNRALAMESACGVVLSEAISLCNDQNVNASEAFNEISLFIMPEYRSFVVDYYAFNRQSCTAMLLADREKLRRLERTTNTDSHGILFVVMDTVRELVERFEHIERLRTSGRQQHQTTILPAPTQYSTLPVPHFFLQRPSMFINRLQNLPDETGFFTALNSLPTPRIRHSSPVRLTGNSGFDDETFISDLVASITNDRGRRREE